MLKPMAGAALLALLAGCGKPAWTATCHNGVTWIVVIGDNGMATVTNPQELQAAEKQP